MSGLTAKKIRAALVELSAEASEAGGAISKEALRARLNISTAKAGDVLKDTVKRFLKSGELRRVSEQSFEYVPEAAPPADSGEGWARVFRAARIAKGEFDRAYVIRLAVLGPTAAGRYLRAMTDGGYLDATGHEGGKIIYRATSRLKNTPTIPPEPKRERVPFVKARAAMGELVNLFVTAELSTEAARRKILEQLAILEKEFRKEVESDY